MVHGNSDMETLWYTQYLPNKFATLSSIIVTCVTLVTITEFHHNPTNMIKKSLLYFSVDRALALYQQHELMRASEEEDRVIRAFSAERNYG